MSSLGACYTLSICAVAAVILTAIALAITAASSRATNWKVIVRNLEDTADRRL